MIKNLLSASVIYSVGPQIPKIASLFILPLITPFLTLTDYGVAGVIFAYTSILAAIGDLGFSVLMMNSFYNYKLKWRNYWGQYYFYLSVWSIFYSIILGLLLYFVIPNEAEQNKFYIILLHVIPSMFFNVTTIMATRYYQFAARPIYITAVSALVGIIAIFANYFTIAYLGLGYMGWFLSNFISSFIAFLFYFFSVYFKIKIYPMVAFRKKFLMQSLRISLPLIPHNYSAYLLNTSDRVVMDRLKVSTSLIGQYNLAYTFGSYMEFFGSAIGMAIGPIYTSMFSDKSKESSVKVKSLTNFLQVLFIFSSFMVSLWCKEIFGLLIKNDSLNSIYPLAIIIIMGYSYRPYYWTAITRLQYSENTKDLWKITFVAGLLNVLLNLIFIPIFGIIAAAISTFLCLLYMGFSGYYLKSFKMVEKETYSPVFYIILIIAATIFVYLLKDISVLIKLGVSLGIVLYILRYCVKYLNQMSN